MRHLYVVSRVNVDHTSLLLGSMQCNQRSCSWPGEKQYDLCIVCNRARCRELPADASWGSSGPRHSTKSNREKRNYLAQKWKLKSTHEMGSNRTRWYWDMQCNARECVWKPRSGYGCSGTWGPGEAFNHFPRL